MEKDAILKTRVPSKTKIDFEAVCQELGVQPTTKLREIVEAFVKREYARLTDRVTVHIHQPTGYDFGAWRVTMRLRNPAELAWRGSAVPFEFPLLRNRLFYPDDGFAAIVTRSDTGEMTVGGQFVNGVWQGHVYSNGIPEAENPTPIKRVEDALTEAVTSLLERFVHLQQEESHVA